MAVILIRHGRVDYDTMALSAEGAAFADYIASQPWSERFPIRKILSDVEERCVATVKPLADKLGLPIDTFPCGAGTSECRNHVDTPDEYVVICVRMEDLPAVLSTVSLSTSSGEAYDRVWRVMPGGRVDSFKAP
jgi:hypothetical protein